MLKRLATFKEWKQAAIVNTAMEMTDQYRYVGIVGALIWAMDEMEG